MDLIKSIYKHKKDGDKDEKKKTKGDKKKKDEKKSLKEEKVEEPKKEKTKDEKKDDKKKKTKTKEPKEPKEPKGSGREMKTSIGALPVPPSFTGEQEYPSEEKGVVAFLDQLAAKGLSGVSDEWGVLMKWMPNPLCKDTFTLHTKENRYADVYCIEWSRIRLKPTSGAVVEDNGIVARDDVLDKDTEIFNAFGQRIRDKAASTSRQAAGEEGESDVPPFTMGATVPPSLGADDYIHANYVDDYWHGKADSPVQFICAQAPMDHTIPQFWRAVYQERVPFIAMLCSLKEQGKDKSSAYWPTKLSEVMDFGNLRVTCTEGQDQKHFAPGESIHLTMLQVEAITPGKDDKPLKLKHFQWTSWPDKSVPTSTKACVALAKHMRRFNGEKCLIHCSAGIGRTGTLLAIALCIQRILHKRPIDIPHMLKLIRQQRVHSIQTAAQYAFVYRAVVQYFFETPDYAEIVKHHTGVTKFMKDYEEAFIDLRAKEQVIAAARQLAVAPQ